MTELAESQSQGECGEREGVEAKVMVSAMGRDAGELLEENLRQSRDACDCDETVCAETQVQ